MRKQVTWGSNWKKKKRSTLQGDKRNSQQGNTIRNCWKKERLQRNNDNFEQVDHRLQYCQK